RVWRSRTQWDGRKPSGSPMRPLRRCLRSHRLDRGTRGRHRTCCRSGRSSRSSAAGWVMRESHAGGSSRSSRGRGHLLEEPIVSERVGLVLGSMDATPLEFWVGVEEGHRVQLDDMIVVETRVPGGGAVQYFGVVDLLRKRYEGAQFDTDAFRATAGTLP